ncbi:NAD(+) synthase [Flavobacteriaceae bacterium]|jgi:NAD+ synthase|nr:NAD(+) synthase [Flavobacteriaceae bacterium]
MQSEKVVNHIVNWLKDYAKNSSINGFVTGISGGIDSAVTSTLCAQTNLPVLCLEMPIHQASSHISRSQEHLLYLKRHYQNVSHYKVNLTPVFEAFKSEVSMDNERVKVDMALANTRARMRMLTLYYHASMFNYLVAGTGNKVEDFGVGFYTKYGDGGVDLSPIADLLKSEVYEIGSYLGVPDSIMNAQPSDGLFGDARSDEDQIGANYDELEWAMKMNDLNKTAADFSGREKQVLQIFKNYNLKNQHKMTPIPVCKIPDNLK